MTGQTFLAFDLGATSGRAVCGHLEGDRFEMKEIHRFPNHILELHGKFYWDIYKLFGELKEALKVCVREGIKITSIGIDTWGVDFGYVAEDGTILSLPRAYRDPYTNGVPEEFDYEMSLKELYGITGIQIMNFNSVFQLYKAYKDDFGPTKVASKILFIPDLFAYMLTGKMNWEYTDASTSQLLNARTKEFDKRILDAINVPSDLMGEIKMPGRLIGILSEEVRNETGIGNVPVVTVASHDTASAVAAVPAINKNFAYLSSGTWSLMGIETQEPIINDNAFRCNFTNEGGIEGTTRFLKNITGMWILEQCKKVWEKVGRSYSYQEIVILATKAAPFKSFIDPDDKSFANPTDMVEAIKEFCQNTKQPIPVDDKEIIRCIFESLAMKYREVLDTLKTLAPFLVKSLYVIGGGANNKLLNQFTSNAIQLPVISGPSEATAIGNCMMQARYAGIVEDRWEMRKLISTFASQEVFSPLDVEDWKKAYVKYKKAVSNKG
jgi:rhamnulokinase